MNPIPNWGLGIGDWGLGIGDWGLGIGSHFPSSKGPRDASVLLPPCIRDWGFVIGDNIFLRNYMSIIKRCFILNRKKKKDILSFLII